MQWHLVIARTVDRSDSQKLDQVLSDERFSVTSEMIDSGVSRISIRCGREVSYTELWDFSSRSLLMAEKLLGEIVLIEGTPRDEYRFQFVAAERCGAFNRDKTHLINAAEKGEIDNIRAFLQSDSNVDVNHATPFGLNALGYAAANGHTEVLKLLIDAGAAPTTGAEITTLQAAVYGGVEEIRLLLAGGADVNGRNRYGETPLMLAAALGKLDVVNRLLSAGADPNVRDKNDGTALDRARQYQRAEVEDALRSRLNE